MAGIDSVHRGRSYERSSDIMAGFNAFSHVHRTSPPLVDNDQPRSRRESPSAQQVGASTTHLARSVLHDDEQLFSNEPTPDLQCRKGEASVVSVSDEGNGYALQQRKYR